MNDTPERGQMDETKRIMERLVKSPPDHKIAKPKGESEAKPKKGRPSGDGNS